MAITVNFAGMKIRLPGGSGPKVVLESRKMKIVRKFADGGVTKEVEQEIYSDYDNLTNVCGKIVSYRGRLWTWEFYGPALPQYDAELLYVPFKGPSYVDMAVNEFIGPRDPLPVKCDCGVAHTFMSNVLDAHSTWCELRTKDGWDEAEKEWKDQIWKTVGEMLRGIP
mgnify:CR=1 FL=1